MAYRVVAAILALGAIATAAFLAFFTGDIVRWTDAYEALEAAEIAHPLRGRDGERVLLANAMVESEPPPGMPIDRRLHPTGTLAHLRYEALARDGTVVSTTDVRALVPALPAFGTDAPGAPFGQTECPRRCAQGLAGGGGMEIVRGGSPGLSPEWVLRMPVGRTFELGMQSFTLQDLEDARPLSLPHARYRVTLLEACRARVRAGAVTNLEFHPHAMVPVPKEFRTRRWVQVDNCPGLAKKRPARPAALDPPPPAAKEKPAYAYAPPKLELIVPRRESPLGRASLVVDEGAMLRRAEAMHVTFSRICRYDAASNRWAPLPLPEGALEIAGPPLMNVTRVAYRFPEVPGLYWAEWSEVPASDRGAARSFALVVQDGPASPGPVPDPSSSCPAPAAVAR